MLKRIIFLGLLLLSTPVLASSSTLVDLACMSSATTGTGTITLGSASTGKLSFAAAGVVNGQTVSYAITDGSNREDGQGVYTSSGTTLTRNTLASSNGLGNPNALSLDGNEVVCVTPTSADFFSLSGANTWSGVQTFNNADLSLAGSSSGNTLLEPTAAAGSGTIATFPANTGILAELNYAQTWSAVQTFNNADLSLAGSSSGNTLLEPTAAAGSGTVATFPANTGTVAELNLAQTWTATQTHNSPTDVGPAGAGVGDTTSAPVNSNAVTVSPRLIATCNIMNITGTSTANGASTNTWIAELFVPANVSTTGAAVYQVATINGNDTLYLADAAGNQILHTASTAASGASAYQKIAWTSSPSVIQGPGTYYIYVQNSGTTNTFGMIPATVSQCGTEKHTGDTYGTFPSISPPTTFTATQGPIVTLY